MRGVRIPADLQEWIEARKRFHLSHMQVQMARELGLNPRKFEKLDNHKQEPWKMPLPQYIEHLYFRHFGKERPDVVSSIEERVRQTAAKKAAKRAAKSGVLAENPASLWKEVDDRRRQRILNDHPQRSDRGSLSVMEKSATPRNRRPSSRDDGTSLRHPPLLQMVSCRRGCSK